jgi:hypothetical protein
MKKFSVAGPIVAAATAATMLGIAAPAFASSGSIANGRTAAWTSPAAGACGCGGTSSNSSSGSGYSSDVPGHDLGAFLDRLTDDLLRDLL